MQVRNAIQYGDFTDVARFYRYRPSYADAVLRCLANYVGPADRDFKVADVAAGTGVIARALAQMGMSGFAIEPNEGMFAEGSRDCADLTGFRWINAKAEQCGLADGSVDWICVGSAVHWMDWNLALREFSRILRRNGYLSVLYNLSDFDHDPLQAAVERRVNELVRGLRRARTPIVERMATLEDALVSSGLFADCLFTEAAHTTIMSVENYLCVLQTAHDLRSQMPADTWNEFLSWVRKLLIQSNTVNLVYRTSAWTVQKRSSPTSRSGCQAHDI
jgi:ubiquinone/menaquinone biosynthesis C-methylase UbiE